MQEKTQMTMNLLVVSQFVLLQFVASEWGDIKVIPSKRIMVDENKPLEITCLAAKKLFQCWFSIPNVGKHYFKPGVKLVDSGFSYFGSSLADGECGIRIENANRTNDGLYKCIIKQIVNGELQVSQEHIEVIVARPPSTPNIQISMKNEDDNNDYTEGSWILAKCESGDGRPAPNISWYFANELVTENVGPLSVVMVNEGKYIIEIASRTTERLLSHFDFMKTLKCVVSHPLLKNEIHVERQLNVNFSPRYPISDFQYNSGEGLFSIAVFANPQPKFIWNIDSLEIREYESHGYGNIKAEPIENAVSAPGFYESRLTIKNISSMNPETSYSVMATNDEGEKTYWFDIPKSKP